MSKKGAYILVVDDEIEIVRALQRGLTVQGYKVLTARTGNEAITLYAQQRPDVVLLDLVMPGMSGLEVCRSIRAESNVPIIVLSIKDAEHDKVQALDLGADDYIAKPFGMKEVLARVRVALRHAAQVKTGADPLLQLGPLQVDFALRKVQVDGREIKLSPTEYELLKAFLASRGKILTRHMLVAQLWGTNVGASEKTHSLHVYVAQLRQKLEPMPEHPRFILTVPGVGYRFADDVEEEIATTQS
ncbi:MAG TPA: response regulator transcription factor [Ktedonobacteraceae bacterium]|jgi:two-component system KDP operon response regulator KdpE|nr:response regulator transcription factor [Ktedonobacteraceae bacterium]